MSKSETVLKLNYPIKHGEELIESLTFKRPKGKDLKHLGANMILKDLLDIASKCSALAPSVFDEMDAQDVMRVGEVINDFLDDGRKTG